MTHAGHGMNHGKHDSASKQKSPAKSKASAHTGHDAEHHH
jgi:hypothetical protein